MDYVVFISEASDFRNEGFKKINTKMRERWHICNYPEKLKLKKAVALPIRNLLHTENCSLFLP